MAAIGRKAEPRACAGAPRAPPTRLAMTRQRMTTAKPRRACHILLFALSTARGLPPAVMYWKPPSMTKNAETTAATAAPAVSRASKILTIGPTSMVLEPPEWRRGARNGGSAVSCGSRGQSHHLAFPKRFEVPGDRNSVLPSGYGCPGNALETLWKRFGNAASRVAQQG